MLANIEISSVLGVIFIGLYWFTVVGLVLLILLENRNPLKTIPWVIVLMLVPGIGLFVYYFFGRENRHLRIISRRLHKRFRKQMQIDVKSHNIHEVPTMFHPLAKLLKRSGYSAFFTGSDITVFTNGKDKFDALIKDIAAAKHHIHLQYYIFNDDNIGMAVRQALIDKAAEGVIVRVIYDDVGSWDTKREFFRQMEQAGIEALPYLKVVFPLLAGKVNYRNHRKVVVIDGKIGYIGGMNIADRYVTGNKLGDWRDTHCRITGPGVYGLQGAFLLDLCAINNNIIKGKEYYPAMERHTDLKMQTIVSGPANQWLTLLQAYMFCITNAKKSIYIQTPYFLPTEALNQALSMAALAGIDVRLMIPLHSDTRSAQLATFSYIGKMLESGVKVYLYDNGFMHSKLLIIDDILTCFGSSNFDFRSFEHNFEINAFVYQQDFTIKMKNLFRQDMTKCIETSFPQWRKRALSKRLLESFMRLFAPLL
ncbi:MAG: cardiolipin synthase [Tannerella sp.]|jgi:cardiolipin synthase|nr:cardiolipin synthase [Tannerella sp.]